MKSDHLVFMNVKYLLTGYKKSSEDKPFVNLRYFGIPSTRSAQASVRRIVRGTFKSFVVRWKP